MSLSIEPSATTETVLTFEEAGELFYGCHVDGHYEAGTVGTIPVT